MSEVDLTSIRRAMISARSVLLTAEGDTPDALDNPARGRVLRRTRERLSVAIAEIDAVLRK